MTLSLRFDVGCTHVASILGILWALLLLSAPLSAAEIGVAHDWPVWRGPDRNSSSTERFGKDWTCKWPAEGPKRLWTAEIGPGYACLAIVGKRGYTLGFGGKNAAGWCDRLYALDLDTGAILWKTELPATQAANKGYETATYPSPVTDGKLVFAPTNCGGLSAHDAETGKLVWSADLTAEGAQSASYGFGSAPLLYKNAVITSYGMAFDKTTGKLLWKSEDARSQRYAAPVPCRIDGQPGVMIAGQAQGAKGPVFTLFGLNIETGKTLWNCPFDKWPLSYPNGIGDPIPLSDTEAVYLCSSGAGRVKYGNGKATLAPESIAFSNSHVCNPVLWQNHLYGFSSYNGDPPTAKDIEASNLQCVDLATGKPKWRKNNFIGTLSLADGKLLILTGAGEFVVAEASPDEFKEIARAQVLTPGNANRDGCWTIPILCGGRIYCRSIEKGKSRIVCLDVSGK